MPSDTTENRPEESTSLTEDVERPSSPVSPVTAKPIRIRSIRRKSSLSIPFVSALTLARTSSEGSVFSFPYAWTDAVDDDEYSQQPMYMSFCFQRNTTNDPLLSGIGLTLEYRDNKCLITSIQQDGPFGGTHLEVGDSVVSINGIGITDPDALAEFMEKGGAEASTEGHEERVLVVCEHLSGDPSVIAAYTEKPQQDCKIGITLTSTSQSLKVSKLDPKGLFGDSLLSVGYRVLLVNGVNSFSMPSGKAVDLLKASPKQISMVARVASGQAVVLASGEGDEDIEAPGRFLYLRALFLLCVLVIGIVLFFVSRGNGN